MQFSEDKWMTTHTEAQKRVLESYVKACEALARAARQLQQATLDYDEAMLTYTRAHGAAHALGVL